MKTHVINWFSFSLLIWWELLNSWVFIYRDLPFVANSNPGFLLKTKITSAFKNVLKTQKLNNQNHRKSSSTRKGHCYKRALNVGGEFYILHGSFFIWISAPFFVFFSFGIEQVKRKKGKVPCSPSHTVKNMTWLEIVVWLHDQERRVVFLTITSLFHLMTRNDIQN